MKNQNSLTDPVALRIPRDVLRQIESIAEITDRSRSWVIVRALKTYLASEGRDILAAGNGRRQIARGDAFQLDDVLDDIDADTRDAAA